MLKDKMFKEAPRVADAISAAEQNMDEWRNIEARYDSRFFADANLISYLTVCFAEYRRYEKDRHRIL